ncbi:McrC family protein [Massilia violaceinigra]|uniref:McrC family protein n=1 Tax=Massilia violaceinigra TaxID=2045208 RepID=A0ABY4ABJ8_9BURK|nr:McrC family protein [Massilia violaceinigra]UOD32155.1 McrC family protein [Massilia violaceinigra]
MRPQSSRPGGASGAQLQVFEYDVLFAQGSGGAGPSVPAEVFAWLESACLRTAGQDETPWLKLIQRGGRRAVQVMNYVGVMRSPGGYQIEVLPKTGRANEGGAAGARQLLIDMLCCLNGFRHIQTGRAKLAAARMPLLEVFMAEFLLSVEQIVKRGLRSDYSTRQDNLQALRGKILISQQLRHNLTRADRFFTEHDEFSSNRPENRLLHTALRKILPLLVSQENQRLARELSFIFAEVPQSTQIQLDFRRVRLTRGMSNYADALAWAELILNELSPVSGSGSHRAPSLLFPMERLFEAFVAKHLSRQLRKPNFLKTQARSHHLVRHGAQDWFRLKPDLLVRESMTDLLVLDTKWKLLDRNKTGATHKYGLAQVDFYQLLAYGQSYLDSKGDVILIYPLTDLFDTGLPVFSFPKTEGLRLWVLPFCLQSRTLAVPADAPFAAHFEPHISARPADHPGASLKVMQQYD